MNKKIKSNYILQGDCLEKLKELPDNSIDSVVTDPPYELGFMGKSWDSTGIAFNVAVWQECLRVLKPGGHLLAFSGSRTYHRMAVAIEDAGFEIRDQIMWVYGSGFPKSHNIGKNIEKINVGGIKNLKKIGVKKGIKVETGTQGYSYSKEYVAGKSMGGKQINGDIPVYEINNDWEGWGTALKPAHEPIVMARKPLGMKTVAENVLTYGTGGINIDGTRVGTETLGGGTMPNLRDVGAMSKEATGVDKLSFGQNSRPAERKDQPSYTGRFPANFIHDGSKEVVALFPDTKGAGGSTPNVRVTGYGKGIGSGESLYTPDDRAVFNSGDGSAARFFYCAKASKKDRNEGLDGFEKKIESDRKDTSKVGSGNPSTRSSNAKVNHHPTVKPTELMKYLVTLVTPPNGIVLDPFLGSGSTAKAATLLGFKWIGCELTPEYIPIIKGRVNWAKAEYKKLNENKQLDLGI